MGLKLLINKINKKNKIKSFIIKEGLNKNLLNKIFIYNKEFINIYKFRLQSYNKLKNLRFPDWSYIEIPDINYDSLIYYSIPIKNFNKELLLIINSLHIDTIYNNVTDIVFDSLSITSSIKPFLLKIGIIFISLFESLFKYNKLVYKYLGTVITYKDNFFSTINSIIFSEGSFGYIPKDIKCTFNLSTYFRTYTENYAQFERTLLIINSFSSVFYIEGCTAPLYKESQLHIAIVEIIVKNYGKINYTTIQNWYKGNILGEGGLYNFTTKRGVCYKKSILEWLQIEIGSYMTWKYPSTLLVGDYSISNFYSISFISDFQIADTGGKMVHIGNYTKSKIVSKSISLNFSKNIYRGLVKIGSNSFKCINKTECDSLILGNNSLTITLPYTIVYNYSSNIQQEAFISKIDINYVNFFMQRCLSYRDSITLIVNGFCTSIYNKLPLEFSTEVPLLISLRTFNIL